MGLDVKLKRASSVTKKGPSSSQIRSFKRLDFPLDWASYNIGYDSLRIHIREYEERKRPVAGRAEETELTAWEQSFVTRLTIEMSKINSFSDERQNEWMEGLRQIDTEVTGLCSRKSISCTQQWHDFLNHYNEEIGMLELGASAPQDFIYSLENHLVKMADKPINQNMLNALKRLVLIHKLSLQLRKFAIYNLSEFKRLLKKHDKKARISLSTEWMNKLQQERFYTANSFEKTVAATKCFIKSHTPTVDDFACPICLELLRKPVMIQCGHKFCKNCLISVSSSYNFCPMCRMEQDLNPISNTQDIQLKLYLRQYFSEEYNTKRKPPKPTKQGKGCTIL